MEDGRREYYLTTCIISNNNQQCATRIVTGEEAPFKMKFEVRLKGFISPRHFAIRVLDNHKGERLANLTATGNLIKEDHFYSEAQSSFSLPRFNLAPGEYQTGVKLPDQRSGHVGASLYRFRSDLIDRAASRHCAKEGIAFPSRTFPLAFIPV